MVAERIAWPAKTVEEARRSKVVARVVVWTEGRHTSVQGGSEDGEWFEGVKRGGADRYRTDDLLSAIKVELRSTARMT